MALFDKKQQEQVNIENDQSYFDGMEGMGLDQLEVTPGPVYISLAQSLSEVCVTGKMKPGTWYNSNTKEQWGETVDVIMLAVKTCWNEKAGKEDKYRTIARYEPNSIPVRKVAPKGGRGFPEMFSVESGNVVEELFVYAVMLADEPELGVCFLTPTKVSMTACKTWNKDVRSAVLPNGGRAPICAYRWKLVAGLAKNGLNHALINAIQGELLPKEIWEKYVQPQLASAKEQILIAAPTEEE